MNFLAHTHLSGENEDVIFGNFIADSVKGKSFNKFRENIMLGILLHREIDFYTDKHYVQKRSKDLIRSEFGKFSGVVTDIYYDHFLARNWVEYSDVELSSFSSNVYLILARRFLLLPSRIKKLLPFLIAQNWLTGYANLVDLARVFKGMDRRTGYISGMNNAIVVLELNYNDLYDDFTEFYPQLQNFAKNKLNELQLHEML
jgi:acyl carrier protein phosphodiesterase